MRCLLLMTLLVGCSALGLRGSPQQGKTTYSYADAGGDFKLVRESKEIKKKIISRTQILDTKGSSSRVLEKAIMVSQIGSIKVKNKRLLTVRPLASEFSVWLEGKKYASKMQLNTKTKSMKLTLSSPEAKWQGTSEIPFPKAKYFCFFNQIPECLYHNSLLVQASEMEGQRYDFYIIWDSYPYIQDQLTGVGKKLFTSASLKFDGEIKKHFRYIVEVGAQMIVYEFTKSFDLVKMAWISQGITVVPPGQEVTDEE